MKQLSRLFAVSMAAILAGNAGATGLGDTLGGWGKLALGLGYERIPDQGLELDSGSFARSISGNMGSPLPGNPSREDARAPGDGQIFVRRRHG